LIDKLGYRHLSCCFLCNLTVWRSAV